MTWFPLKCDLCTKQVFSPLTPLHVDLLFIYIVYSVESKLMYVGLGFFEVGGATRTSKTFATSMSRFKGPGAGIVALRRFWMEHQETALDPQQELPARFCCSLQAGVAAGALHTVLLTSSFPLNLCLCSIFSSGLLYFGLRVYIQGCN